MLWEIDIYPKAGEPDRQALAVAAEAADLGLSDDLAVSCANGYLIQGAHLSANDVQRIVRELLVALRRGRVHVYAHLDRAVGQFDDLDA